MVKKDSILLRWAPLSLPAWQIGNNYGYMVKRYTISSSGNFISDGLKNGKLMTEQPIKPESNESFSKLASIDKRALVVQEAIYGNEFQPAANLDFNSVKKVYDELELHLGFALFMCDMSPAIARAAGLSYTDTDVSENERYVYAVTLANVPDGLNADPSVIVVDADIITQLPAVTDIQAIFLDRTVKFRWPVTFHKGTYSAYTIDKSIDGGEFKPVSELPLVNFSENDDQDYFIYTDSLESNDQQVAYTVRGISPFGEKSPPSITINGKGKKDFAGYVTIDTAFVTDKSMITLKWRITESAESPVTSINVLRSNNYNGTFEIINKKPLDAGTRTFTDISPGGSNYYQVMIKGKNDLKSYSFPYLIQTEDNDPPATPQMLSGSIDSSGVASIIWKKNSEPDLLGYKIFRGNSVDDEFVPVSGDIQSNNICHDTINLNSLTQKIYYTVVAVDRNYNNSEYSTVLELSRPDTIPPSPAIITRMDYSAEKIIVQLEESPSNDISDYVLHLKGGNDSSDVFIKSWGKNLPDTYEYVPQFFGKNMEFTLTTIDNAGNSSVNKHQIFIPRKNIRIISLRAEQAPDGRTIELHWEIPEGFNPVRTIIYRNTSNEPVSLYKTFENPESNFLDKNIVIGNEYTYRVVIYNDNESVSSEKQTMALSRSKKRQYVQE